MVSASALRFCTCFAWSRLAAPPFWRALQLFGLLLGGLLAGGASAVAQTAQAYTWGTNGFGQLGNNTTTNSSVPLAVTTSGVLAGKTITAVAVGGNHSVAVDSNGAVYTWGNNGARQLGDNSTTASSLPLTVITSGTPMESKTINAVAAGYQHTLALDASGVVYSWGSNFRGSLGNNSTTDSGVPVAVTTSGTPMSGKTITMITAGNLSSVVLASDGTVFSWGENNYGVLGNNSNTPSLVPVAVATSGTPMEGKSIKAVAAGGYHILALASDGTLFAWGEGDSGQLGNNSTTFQQLVPVAVTTSGTPLENKTITAVAAGQYHSLALASDGTVYAWGYGGLGQLGNGSTTQRTVPVAVTTSGTPMAGKTITAIAAGANHSLALASDGTVYAWGAGGNSQLGNNATIQSAVPVAVNAANGTSALYGLGVVGLARGALASHALVIAQPGPTVTAISPSTGSTAGGTSVTLTGTNFTGATGVTIGGTAATSVVVTNPTTLTCVAPAGTAGTASVLVTTSAGTNAANTLFTYAAAPTVTAISPSSATAAGGTRVTITGTNFTGATGVTIGGVAATGVVVINATTLTCVAPAGTAGTASVLVTTPGGTNAANTLYTYATRTASAYAWGYNDSGQVGDNSTTVRLVPVAVTASGALSGKTIAAVAMGLSHSVALASDGTVYAWGYNSYGQLGNGSTTASNVPVAVDTTGVLAGKTITAIAAGQYHTLALASDGTVYAWGINGNGSLGDSTTTRRTSPVAVTTSGALAGKTITAIAAGSDFSLAVDSDGVLYAWGYNVDGRLGNGTTTLSSLPVAVTMSGVLAGKTITAIATGQAHTLALASDGTVYAWGFNGNGQLGDSTTTQRTVPVAVTTSGALSGKIITAIAAGQNHSLALASDGTVYAWGYGNSGQLGNGSTTSSAVPVAVTASGALAGKTITAVAAGLGHSAALASDGTLYTWGRNATTSFPITTYGSLGNNSTANSSVPVAVNVDSGTSALSGQTVFRLAAGSQASHALVIAQAATPTVTAISPSSGSTAGGTSVTLTGTGFTGATAVTIGGTAATSFTVVSDTSITATTPAGTAGTASVVVTTPGGTNTANTLYTYVAAPTVTAISPSSGSTAGGTSVTLTGTNFTGATAVTIGGTAATSFTVVSATSITATTPAGTVGTASVLVTTPGGTNAANTLFTYAAAPTVTAISPSSATAAGGTRVTITGTNFTGATGVTIGGVAATGVVVINATTLTCIAPAGTAGTASVLVTTPGGTNAANTLYTYATRTASAYAWGYNNSGQLGDNSATVRKVPVAVTASGALAGKTIVAVAVGSSHSVALTTEGKVYTWGANGAGQLGNGSTTASTVPVAVTTSGVLAGKTITAVAAGDQHTLALASDGTVYAWGYGNPGQLGNGATDDQNLPVAVTTTGVLAGKTIAAIAAGGDHSLAVDSDGVLYAWGQGGNGALGNGSTASSSVPVAVTMSGALAGKRITAVAGGSFHTVALASDGTVYAWGYGGLGQLGNSSTSDQSSPVAVTTSGTPMASKTITAIAAGSRHSVALASDGTVYAWGYGDSGRLGNSSTSDQSSPVAVMTSGTPMASKTITAIAAGYSHSVALASDGTAYAWGRNAFITIDIVPYGSLGNNSTTNSSVPVAVNTDSGTSALSGQSVVRLAAGSQAQHALVIAQAATPTVTAISPSSGSTAGGTSVTITGTGFTGATAVTFGGNAATGVTVVSDTSITATTPAGTAGTASVVVTTPGGSNAANTLYTYIAPPAVTNSTLTLAATYGTAISTYTITGSNTPTSYSATGLPAGLAVDTATGAITGTPTATGPFSVTIGVTNAGGTGTATLTVNVAKAMPAITWSTPSAITYGTALSATQLNASASVAGAFTYSPASGTTPNAGTQTLSVAFVPTDTTNYNAVAATTVSLTVNKAMPAITWSTPSAITYGTALSTTQLNASSGGVAGAFTYSPASGTTPNAGTQTLSVAFVPTDTTNYNAVAATTVSLVVNKATPTITWSTPSAITYGTALSATQLNASSGGVAGTFTYSPASGTTPNAGTQTLSVAFVPTDTTNYNAVAATNVSLTVNKAGLTVTADAKTRAYGAANPPLTATLTGFKNSETAAVVSGGAALATAATSTSTVGDYPITVTAGTLAATNYTFTTLTPGILTVAKAPLTVTADAKTRAYGDANPALTATITGYVNGDTAAVVTGAPALTTGATLTSPVGGYAITPTAGTLAATNYAFTTLTPGTLTVTPAGLTVTADAKTKFYGAPNPTLTATLTGFKNNETAAVVAGAPALATTATTASGVNAYPITAALGTLAASNYSFAFAPGTLTVNPAPLTVTADNKNRVYGVADPAFTATLSGFVNGDTAAAVTGTAAFTTTATGTSPAGAYPITPALGTLTAANYTFATFTPGTLMIGASVQTVALGAIANKTYGDAPFTVSATTSSGLPAAYSIVSGPATISSNTVTLTGTGAVVVRATQSGDANFNAATPSDQSFTVAKKTLTVTADNQTRAFGAANPALTATLTGFVNGETSAVVSGSAALSTTATPTSAAGSYPIAVTGGTLAATNYDFGFVTGTLTVGATGQTITFAALANVTTANGPIPLTASATSGLPVTFTLVSGPATLSNSTLTLTGATGTVVVRASQPGNANFTAATAVDRSFTVASATPPPVIAQAPASRTLNAGDSATLTVAALGEGVLTYQWFKDGSPLPGATAPSLALANVTTTQAGLYRVEVTNAGGTTRSAAATLTVTNTATAPVILVQPSPQTVPTGGTATFTVVATGNPAPNYQWRKNGTSLPNATTPTLTLANVQPGDVASYDVLVSNTAGAVPSSFVPLILTDTPVAPVITRQPAGATAVIGTTVTLSVAATGVPAPAYQWQKDGQNLPDATAANLILPNLTTAQAGSYTVTVSNPAGTVPSRPAALRVQTRSYAGTYFGRLGNGGSFALYIREDQTGVFLAFNPGSGTAYLSRTLTVDEQGRFTFTSTVTGAAGVAADLLPSAAEPTTAAAELVFTGTITPDGTVAGTAGTLTLDATRSAPGATQAVAGYYEAGSGGTSARTFTIVGASGQALVVVQTATGVDAGVGSAGSTGNVTVTTAAGQTVAATVSATTNAVTATVTDTKGVGTAYAGTSDNTTVLAAQRLANLSTRARAGTGEQVVIAGFVIAGDESKPVLIRAVGPALTAFGVDGALAAPKLDLYRGSTVIATNTGWSRSPNAVEIAAAAARSGAFAFGAGSADSALLTTLAPGAYTAIISSASNAAGVALAEVYDLSGAASGQKLVNLATRAVAGTASDTLIAGVVVSGTAPKRVLIRAAGPALAAFGLNGALARPKLELYSGSTVIAQNTGWSTSTDAAGIALAATQAGAFAFPSGSADSAILIYLPPGGYTAQVSGVGGTTGVALVEVYEVP